MRPKILLVEDDIPLAQALVIALDEVHIEVDHCTSAELAMRLIEENDYPLAVVDVVLADGTSGLYVVSAIRRLPPERRPETLIITGAKLEALRGVDRSVVTAVLLKPLDFDLFTEFARATYVHALAARRQRASRTAGAS